MIIVAGVGGGVGTTTITALLFAALSGEHRGAPRLQDHSGGDLGLRLPAGDEVTLINDRLLLADLGPHAGVGAERLAGGVTQLLVVAAATPAGCGLASEVIGEIDSRFGAHGLRQTMLASVGVFGRHRITGQLEALCTALGNRGVVAFPRDLALAAGGRVPLSRISLTTQKAQERLASVVRDRALR